MERTGGFGPRRTPMGARKGFQANPSSGFGTANSGFTARRAPAKAAAPRSRYPVRIPVDPDAEPVVLTEAARSKLVSRAVNIALWHLEQSAKTNQELRERLRRKLLPEDIIDGALTRLAELGYVDDANYAQQFVRSRHQVRRHGAQVIRFALRGKGVAPELITAAVEQISPESELANARFLVERAVRRTRGLDRIKRTNRLVGMLARKGYGAIAYTVVREALAADQDAENLELTAQHHADLAALGSGHPGSHGLGGVDHRD